MSILSNQTKVIILIIIVLVILFLFKNKKENYDARISNINKIEKCANMCSSVYGCGGFSYNTNDNNDPADTPIYSFMFCNTLISYKYLILPYK